MRSHLRLPIRGRTAAFALFLQVGFLAVSALNSCNGSAYLWPGPNQLTINATPAQLPAGTVVRVRDGNGTVVGTDALADNGTAVVFDLPEGSVNVEAGSGSALVQLGSTVIPGPQPPSTPVQQEFGPGFTYIQTRDGTTLSAYVTLPGPVGNGPYPTLIEYSGYAPSSPNSSDPSRRSVPARGFALVQVNLRGTGCSGGAFRFFDRIQSHDGYDVVEAVAAQPWSAGVGMYGLSYPGIMQLHVASTQPPSLEAIAPLSVMDRPSSVVFPGGILNNGFALGWLNGVLEAAKPSTPGWAQSQASQDSTCAANMAYRSHNESPSQALASSGFDYWSNLRTVEQWMGNVDVPLFMTGAWQDEQTGSGFGSLLDDVVNLPAGRAVLFNGTHEDGFQPTTYEQLFDFYDMYVANRSPYPGLTVAEARYAYAAGPPIEVLFDVVTRNGVPSPGASVQFNRWPPADSTRTIVPIGGFGSEPSLLAPGTAGGAIGARSDRFVIEPGEGQQVTINDPSRLGDAWPPWNWPAPQPGRAVVATSDPLTDDVTMVGSATANLWLNLDSGSSAPVEATISEVHPDGLEVLVQTGRLQVTGNGLAQIEIGPFAHVFRSGSSVRLTIDTAGASMARWRFATGNNPTGVTLVSTPEFTSQLVLPITPNVAVPGERPACGSLRGQPCRRR